MTRCAKAARYSGSTATSATACPTAAGTRSGSSSTPSTRAAACAGRTIWGPRLDTTEGASWEYAWYTPLDVIPSPYYEAVREAWDDRRYVETLKKVARENGADISAFLAEIAEAGKNLRGEGGRETVNDFWAASKRIEAMDELRAKVVAKIQEVGKKGQPGAATQPTR